MIIKGKKKQSSQDVHIKKIINSINYTEYEYVKLYLANVYGHSK